MHTLIAAVLAVQSLSLGGAAAGDRGPLIGVCKLLEQPADLCEGGARMSLLGAWCDRVEKTVHDLCGPLETIVATPSADGAVLDLLRQDYEVVPMDKAVFPYSHFVVGYTDLQDPRVAGLVKKTFRAGKTVAIVGATEDEVGRFHRLIFPGQAADCVSPDGQAGTIDLYALQRTGNPPQIGSYCLPDLDVRHPETDRRWLRERFADRVPGEVGAQLQDDSNAQLISIATGKSCSYKSSSGVGNVSWRVQVWAMRNFAEGQDYYLVNFNPTFTPLVSNVTQYVVDTLRPTEVKGSTSGAINTSDAFIFDEDPATQTSYVESYDNSSSTTVGGSAGVDGTNVQVSANASVTIGNSTTTHIPAVTILQQTNTLTVEPSWTFKPQTTVPSSNYAPMTAWVWQIPQDAYPFQGTGTNQLGITAQANIFTSSANSNFSSPCNVAVPFQAWSVAAPVLTRLGSSSAAPGDNIAVEGMYMYPDVVTNVFLGGTPVSPSNLVFDSSSTSFTLIVPNVGSGTKDVQVETTVTGPQLSNKLPLDITD
jgi:hypothetical protein